MIDTARVEVLTDASGDFSTTTVHLNGLLHGFALVLGTSTSLTLTIANADGITLFSEAALVADELFLPRLATVSEAGVDITYDGTRKVFDAMPVNGELTITVAIGGDAKTADVVLYMER